LASKNALPIRPSNLSNVHRVDAALEAAVLALKLRDGVVVELAFVPVAFP